MSEKKMSKDIPRCREMWLQISNKEWYEVKKGKLMVNVKLKNR